MNSKKREINYIIIYITSIFAFLFMPSSVNGESNDLFTIPIYLICLACIIYFIIKGNIEKRNFIIWIVIIINLLFFSLKITMTNNITNMRLGVILQHITFFLLSITIFPDIKFNKKYINIFNFINIIMILWGFGIILKVGVVEEFTAKYFTWGSKGVTLHMLNANKPILSFGVHSVAAFFFCQMFFLNYITYKSKIIKMKLIYLIFMICFIIMCIFLKSTTSLILSILMVIFLILLSKKVHIRIGGALLIIIFIGAFLHYNPEIYYEYVKKVSGFGGAGGITARYSSDLFETHINYVKNNGFIGFSDIGFTYNTDSGYILNYMRGGLLNVVLLMFVNCRLFFNNVNKMIAIYSSVMIIIFDSITTMFMYPQVVAFIIWAIIYIKILSQNDN